MASWNEVRAGAAELATAVQKRFDATGLGLLATIRNDGAPRISGIEPLFALEQLWLGMMPGSRKAADLLRDPRFALHCATTDQEVKDGDAKISGLAVLTEDDETVAAFRAAFADHSGYPPPPGPFHLFRADVTEMSFLRPAGDHLDIDWWRQGEVVRRVERF